MMRVVGEMIDYPTCNSNDSRSGEEERSPDSSVDWSVHQHLQRHHLMIILVTVVLIMIMISMMAIIKDEDGKDDMVFNLSWHCHLSMHSQIPHRDRWQP